MRRALGVIMAAALLTACGGDDNGGGGRAEADPTYEEVKAAALSMPEVQGQCERPQESEDIENAPKDYLPDHRRTMELWCPDRGYLFDYTEFERADGVHAAVEGRKPAFNRGRRLSRRARQLQGAYFINNTVLVVPGPMEDARGRPIPAAAIVRAIQRSCDCGEIIPEPLG